MKEPRTWGGSPDSEMDVFQICLLGLFDLGQRCQSLRAGVGWIVKSEVPGLNGFISNMRKLGSGDVTLCVTQGLRMGTFGGPFDLSLQPHRPSSCSLVSRRLEENPGVLPTLGGLTGSITPSLKPQTHCPVSPTVDSAPLATVMPVNHITFQIHSWSLLVRAALTSAPKTDSCSHVRLFMAITNT